MEQVKRIILQHEDKLKHTILAGAGIAAFNTLSRPDFNLILYLYIYYVWNMMNDSKVIFLTLTYIGNTKC